MFPLAFLLLFQSDPAAPVEDALKRFLAVFAAVQEHAADPAPADRLFYEGALPAMMRQLDPHSVFFDPAQFEQLKQMERSEQKGFGSVVSVLPGRVIVLQTLPGTPSAKAGLSPGDEILGINGYVLAQLEFEQLIQLLGAARQQPAQLTVRRPGNSRLMGFTLVPALLEQPSVERAFLMKPGIGYLRVSSFDTNTARLVHESIEQLGGRSLKGLVLDLRNNPGGVAAAAAEIAAMFLKPGQRILSVKGRSKKEEVLDVPAAAQPYDFPVAVLVNEKSASASEIVTGAIQDHDRGVVLGEPSFGKGLVQSVYPLTGGSGVALTTAFYYTPSGRSIQKPLREGTLQRDQERTAEYKTDKGRIVKGGGGITPDEIVLPPMPSRLVAVLEASASYQTFATEYLSSHKVDEEFDVDAKLLDEFQVFLSGRNIRPGVGEWLRDREFIQSRLKQELFNQAFGVAKGDEVEVARDPVIRRAVELLGR
jgi:carboxyl-terminal processing protease